MKYLKTITVALVLILLTGTSMITLSSCVSRGGKASVQQEQYSKTLGEELQDLEEAYKKGIITKKQYEKAKKDLIKKRTK